MKFNILVDEDIEMTIGDSKQIDNEKRKITVGENLKKVFNSLNTKNKKWNTKTFFDELKNQIKSFYVINNDLMTGTRIYKSNSINFIIFFKKANPFFENGENNAINIKTFFSENKREVFWLTRLDILHDFNESFLKKYKNYNSEHAIEFYLDKNTEFSTIESEIVKHILFSNENNVLLMKNLMKGEQNNGKLKLRWTYNFYKDYIQDQWEKYDKNNKSKQKNFPIVLRISSSSNENKTEFIYRREKKSHNKNFLDINNTTKKFIYFYNVNDSDEKVKIPKTKFKISEFKYIEKVDQSIKWNENEITNSRTKIKDIENNIKKVNDEVNRINNLLKPEKEQLDNLQNQLNEENQNYNLRQKDFDTISSNIKKIEQEIQKKSKQIEEKEAKIKKLRKSKKHENEVAKINQEIKKNSDEKNNLIFELENLDKDFKQKDTKLKETKTNLLKLEEKFKEIDNNVKKFITAKNDQIKRKDNFQKEIQDTNKYISTLREEIEKLIIIKEKEKDKYDYYIFNIPNNLMGNLRPVDVFKIWLPKQNPKFSEVVGFSNKFIQNSDFILSDEDYGAYSKHKRFYNSLKNFMSGEYKNPLLAKSIEDPDFFKINTKDIEDYDLKMNPKIKLNDKQIESVKKAMLTPCVSYLQGPPGTGKTQTISGIIYHVINQKRKNVLLMSSTHEAILNAFDRIQQLTENDPNFIFYKTIRKKEENKKTLKNTEKTEVYEDDESNLYDLEHAFYRFSTAIINATLMKNNDNILNSIVEDMYVIDKQRNKNNFEKNKALISFVFILVECIKNNNLNLFKNSFDNSNKKYNFEELINIFEKEYEDNITEIKFSFEDAKREISRKRENEAAEHIKELKNQLLRNERIQNLYTKIQISNLEIKDIDPKFLSNDEIPEILKQKLNILKSRIENKQDFNNSEIKEKFSNHVFENELVNLIGLTTTANQVITQKTETKQNQKALFLQYPIYATIIDEVSKSSTLEIINSCMLSEKILLAGDYKQLPPVLDLETGSTTDEKIENIELNKLLNSFPDIRDLKIKKEAEQWKDNDKTWFSNEKIKELLLELKYPFFKFHALKLKSKTAKSDTTNFYTFLTEQHRFNPKIQEVVNVCYDKDEKLTTPITSNSPFLLNYKRPDIKNKKEYIVIDTTKINEEFLNTIPNKYKDIVYKHKLYAFDQTQTMDNSDKKESTINEYNAFVIADLIENICTNYYEETKEKFDLDKIGVISMTRSQNPIIREKLREKMLTLRAKTKNKVKVDTVDNFQGREKEIIIVDFVRAKGSLNNDKLEYKAKRNYDFYKSVERVNVAVSRAKDNLILVGAFKELKSIEFAVSRWSDSKNGIENKDKKIIAEYIKIAEDYDTYREAWDE
ncbi:AAA domain-containing protein [Mycoplasma zalophi]|uniref:AAA domain-containing protein n=1 Tax=Mycoplasma zalophi TaxID=191287 RepID=UPI001C1173A4|nr:AAA domain-containing protein [Mycoplasma zalophi]MBU4691110.1 AAA family ATPase [Mycoplasma zalophi]